MRLLCLVLLMFSVPAAAAAVKGVRTGAAAEAAGKAAEKKAEEDVFILPDMGWRDVFTDPREAHRGGPVEIEEKPDVGEEWEKIWDDAVAELTVETIIGFETDLAAVIAGVTVRPGGTVTGGKLKFEVEKITKDAVYLRCVSEEETFSPLRGLPTKKRIVF